METGVAAIMARGFAEYGVLAVGWIAWLWTMLYVRYERKRYQELVVHIVEYFTKTRLVENKNDSIQLPASLFSDHYSDADEQPPRRSADSSHHATEGGFEIRRRNPGPEGSGRRGTPRKK